MFYLLPRTYSALISFFTDSSALRQEYVSEMYLEYYKCDILAL